MPWTPLQALVVFIVPFVILPLVLVIWLGILAPFFPPIDSYLNALDQSDPRATFTLVIFDAVSSYALIGYYLKKTGARWRDLGIRSFSIFKALVTIVLMLVAFVLAIELIYQLVQILVPGFDPNQAQENEFTNVAPQFQLYSLLALVIFPPLVEEAIFRGFMFPAFSKRFGLVGGAIISSLLFGLAHFQANIVVYTFFIGLILCFLYVRTRSIIPGMILHMINNYLAYMAMNQTQ